MHRWLSIVLAFFFLCAAADAEAQARRIALVIGNADYARPDWRLANPVHDAELINTRLKEFGFEVDLVRNANKREMDAAFARFGQRLKAGGRSTEAVFYYSGHGAQQDGVNYLIPIDANARTADQLKYQAPAMQFLLDYMSEARNAINILILDACRDMPLVQGLRGGEHGLADMGAIPNLLIAYSAGFGRTAADGDGYNSPYTEILGKYLKSGSGASVHQLFADVQGTVYDSTGGAQVPEYRDGLMAPRYSFKEGGGVAELIAVPQTTKAKSRPVDLVPAFLAAALLIVLAFALVWGRDGSLPVKVALIVGAVIVACFMVVVYPAVYTRAATAIRAFYAARDAETADRDAYRRAKEDGTLSAFQAYLRTFPAGKNRGDALLQVRGLTDDAAWREAKALDTVVAYSKYIEEFPTGKNLESAQVAATRLSTIEVNGCNDTDNLVRVAIISRTSNTAERRVSGWKPVAARSCAVIATTGASEFYYSAISDGGTWGRGYKGCVMVPGEFDAAFSESCPEGTQIAQFTRVALQSGRPPPVVRFTDAGRIVATNAFYGYNMTSSQSAHDVGKGRVLQGATWLRRPGAREFDRYYPPLAAEREKEGRVVLNCDVFADGAIDCRVASETPDGWGFGEAAVQISKYFRMAPMTASGQPTSGGTISVPITFKLGG